MAFPSTCLAAVLLFSRPVSAAAPQPDKAKTEEQLRQSFLTGAPVPDLDPGDFELAKLIQEVREVQTEALKDPKRRDEISDRVAALARKWGPPPLPVVAQYLGLTRESQKAPSQGESGRPSGPPASAPGDQPHGRISSALNEAESVGASWDKPDADGPRGAPPSGTAPALEVLRAAPSSQLPRDFQTNAAEPPAPGHPQAEMRAWDPNNQAIFDAGRGDLLHGGMRYVHDTMNNWQVGSDQRRDALVHEANEKCADAGEFSLPCAGTNLKLGWQVIKSGVQGQLADLTDSNVASRQKAVLDMTPAHLKTSVPQAWEALGQLRENGLTRPGVELAGLGMLGVVSDAPGVGFLKGLFAKGLDRSIEKGLEKAVERALVEHRVGSTVSIPRGGGGRSDGRIVEISGGRATVQWTQEGKTYEKDVVLGELGLPLAGRTSAEPAALVYGGERRSAQEASFARRISETPNAVERVTRLIQSEGDDLTIKGAYFSHLSPEQRSQVSDNLSRSGWDPGRVKLMTSALGPGGYYGSYRPHATLDYRIPSEAELEKLTPKADYALEKQVMSKGADLMAHGVESTKGGLTNLVDIILEGRIGRPGSKGSPYFGVMGGNDATYFSGGHGPYYVIVDKQKPGNLWPSETSHQAYVVPSQVHKQIVVNALRESLQKGMISQEIYDQATAKLMTYQEFLRK